MRYSYDKSRTPVVSCKSNLQLAYGCRVRHKECRELMKHVSKPYDNRSHSQFDIVEIVYDFSMRRVAHAIKIACGNRKQKSYCVKALLASFKNRIRFPLYKIACRYDCCRVFKHVSKAHDILRVVHDKNRKQVVGLIYTKRFVS